MWCFSITFSFLRERCRSASASPGENIFRAGRGAGVQCFPSVFWCMFVYEMCVRVCLWSLCKYVKRRVCVCVWSLCLYQGCVCLCILGVRCACLCVSVSAVSEMCMCLWGACICECVISMHMCLCVSVCMRYSCACVWSVCMVYVPVCMQVYFLCGHCGGQRLVFRLPSSVAFPPCLLRGISRWT